MTAPDQPLDALHSVLESFPPVQHAFAYGSGIFKQPGLYNEQQGGAGSGTGSASGGGDRPMLDFIFGVEDPVAWHAEVCSLTSLLFLLVVSGRQSLGAQPTGFATLSTCRTCGAMPTTTPSWVCWALQR
jgi:hypothetical protein